MGYINVFNLTFIFFIFILLYSMYIIKLYYEAAVVAAAVGEADQKQYHQDRLTQHMLAIYHSKLQNVMLKMFLKDWE